MTSNYQDLNKIYTKIEQAGRWSYRIRLFYGPRPQWTGVVFGKNHARRVARSVMAEFALQKEREENAEHLVWEQTR